MEHISLDWNRVFREVSRRKVGGGSKSTGADEIVWEGVLGGRRLRVVSRVRLNNPMESFLTPSNMRLRDSHVGREGHFVQLTISAAVPDPVAAELLAMAQAADNRAIVLKRSI